MATENGEWDPRINAATSIGRGRFCVTLCELQYDDPFTALIEYDDAFPQPWSRVDVGREIYAVDAARDINHWKARFVALSNEGDIYWIGDHVIHEKIIGSGVQSSDATGAGALANLRFIDDRLWAVGHGSQIYYRHSNGKWRIPPVDIKQDHRFNPIRIGKISGTSYEDIYIAGSISPKRIDIDEKTEKFLMESSSWDDWDKSYEIARENSPSKGLVTEGRAYHWNGTSWTEIPIPG